MVCDIFQFPGQHRCKSCVSWRVCETLEVLSNDRRGIRQLISDVGRVLEAARLDGLCDVLWKEELSALMIVRSLDARLQRTL